MKAYNPNDFEYSKENTDYIKLKCISCNNPVVLPAEFSDGHRCRLCNNYMSPVSYVRRKDRTKLREVVEVCPHCMRENTFMLSDRDIQLLHGKVHCKCGEDVRNWTVDEPFNYCPYCGQKIDWTED